MTCLFCDSSQIEEASIVSENKINPQLAEYLCLLLGVSSDESYCTAFCQCSYCDTCEHRIYKGQTLLQKLEVIQNEIETTRKELEENLRKTYLSNKGEENDNDDGSFVQSFRRALVSELNLDNSVNPEPKALGKLKDSSSDHDHNYTIGNEVNDCAVDDFVEPEDNWGFDDYPETEDVNVDKKHVQKLSPRSQTIKANSKHRSSVNNIPNYSDSIAEPVFYHNGVELKNLSILLEPLSSTVVESMPVSRSKSTAFNLRGRIRCSQRSCFQYFSNKSALKKHLKLHHSAKSNSKKASKQKSLESDVEDVISGDDYSDSDEDFVRGKDGDVEEDKLHPHRPFSCTFEGCRSSLTSAEKLDAHIKSKHEGSSAINPSRYACTESDCKETFREFRSLHAHIKKVHLGYENPHECEICPAAFRSRNLLTNHLKQFHPDRPKLFVCRSCLKEFQEHSHLNDHILLEHPETCTKLRNPKRKTSTKPKIIQTDTSAIAETNLSDSEQVGDENFSEFIVELEDNLMFPCPAEGCTRKFSTKSIRQRHMQQVHLGKTTKTLKCTEEGCEAMFRDRISMKYHVNKVHFGSATPYACGKCDASFATRNLLQNHKTENPSHDEKRGRKPVIDGKSELHICHHCGNTYKNRESFRMHLRLHGPKNKVCSVCNKGFVKLGDLKNHMLTHTKEKTVVCYQCGKRLRDQGGLNHHLRICSKRDMKAEFKCDKCQRYYKYQSTYDAHMKEHDGEVVHPHKCDFPGCEYACKFQSMLVLHKQSHVTTKDFACDMCPSKFKYKQHLMRHRDLRHFGKRGTHCTHHLCSFVGISKSSLIIHMRSHTGEKPFECQYCGNRFTSSAHLKRHCLLHESGKTIRSKKRAKCDNQQKETINAAIRLLEDKKPDHDEDIDDGSSIKNETEVESLVLYVDEDQNIHDVQVVQNDVYVTSEGEVIS